MSSRLIGFVIEGLGVDASSKDNEGVCYVFGDPEQIDTDSMGKMSPQQAAGDIEMANLSYEQQITTLPSTVEVTLNPEQAELEVDSMSFNLNLDPETVSPVLKALQPRPSFNLSSKMTVGDPTMEIDDPDWSPSLPTEVYIGSETIRVDSKIGPKTYDVKGGRGYWHSNASFHAGPGQSKNRGAAVYERPPFYSNRLVRVLTIDEQNGGQQRRLYVVDNIEEMNGGTRLKLDTSAALAAAKDAKINRGAPPLSEQSPPNFWGVAHGVANRSTYSPREFQINQFVSRVAKHQDSNGNWSGAQPPGEGSNRGEGWYLNTKIEPGDAGDPPESMTTSDRMYYKIASESITYLVDKIYPAVRTRISGNPVQRGRVPQIEGNENIDVGRQGDVDLSDSYEMLMWHQQIPKAPYPLADMREAVGSSEFHPLVPVGCILFSDDTQRIDPSKFDFLAPEQGLGLYWLFGQQGVDDLVDIISNEPAVTFDQLYLGADGDAVDAFDECMQIMASYGYSFTMQSSGQFSFIRNKILTNQNVNHAIKNNTVKPLFPIDSSPDWGWDTKEGLTWKNFVAKIGESPVWKGTEDHVVAIQAANRVTRLETPEKSDFDFKTLETEKPNNDQHRATKYLETKAIRDQRQPPELKFAADDFVWTGKDYTLGEFIHVELPEGVEPTLIYGPDGQLSETLDDFRLVGKIVGNEWHIGEGWYTLTVEMVGFRMKKPALERAPAWKVKSIDQNAITVDVGTYADSTNEERNFNLAEPGMEVEFFDDRLAKKPIAPVEIDQVNTTTNPKEYKIFLPVGTEPDLNQGDIVRLANYNDYDTPFAARQYAFISSGGELGNNGAEPDQWQ